MKSLTKLFSESMDQQFTVIYSKLKPDVKIKDQVGNILTIQSIENKKRLQVALLKNEIGDIIKASFPEIATLVINKNWEILN